MSWNHSLEPILEHAVSTFTRFRHLMLFNASHSAMKLLAALWCCMLSTLTTMSYPPSPRTPWYTDPKPTNMTLKSTSKIAIQEMLNMLLIIIFLPKCKDLTPWYPGKQLFIKAFLLNIREDLDILIEHKRWLGEIN